LNGFFGMKMRFRIIINHFRKLISDKIQVSKLPSWIVDIVEAILALVGAEPLSIVRLSTMVAGLFG
jgi:hypothetical protein